MEKLKPCPFCGGKVKLFISDDEGNLRNKEYEVDAWSGLSYQLSHHIGTNPDCPIASHDEDGGIIGIWLYESKEEAIKAWNKRL